MAAGACLQSSAWRQFRTFTVFPRVDVRVPVGVTKHSTRRISLRQRLCQQCDCSGEAIAKPTETSMAAGFNAAGYEQRMGRWSQKLAQDRAAKFTTSVGAATTDRPTFERAISIRPIPLERAARTAAVRRILRSWLIFRTRSACPTKGRP